MRIRVAIARIHWTWARFIAPGERVPVGGIAAAVMLLGGVLAAPGGATVGRTPEGGGVLLEKRVATSADDAEESSSGSVGLTSSDLELVFDNTNQTVGMRWAGLAIPPGSTVTSAYVQFGAKESQSEATSLAIRGQAADNAAVFGTTTRNVSGRALTGAAVSWAPVAWVAGEVGANQRTPDLSAVIQEIVNRPGWASGNAMALVITGTGHRTAWAYNGSPAAAPLLHIEFLSPDAPAAVLTVRQLATPPLTVRADGSGSYDNDVTPIATYSFDFGDGTAPVTTAAPAAAAEHGYAAAGSYTVTLIATDTGGNASFPAIANVTVQPDTAPVARLAVAQVASPAFTVRADGAASSDGDLTPIASYQFDFGDGSPAATVAAPATSAQHSYAAEGTHTVTLMATDVAGNASFPAVANVTVQADTAPVARVTVTQLASPALTVQADGSGSSDGDLTAVASYRFDFGDGTAAVTVGVPGTTAHHTYAAAGTYTVTLVATDAGGNASAPGSASIVVSTATFGARLLEGRVAASTDDAEETTSGTVSVTSSDLELVYDNGLQTVGMRWAGVAIPPGSTVSSAYVQFSAKESQSEATSLAIRGQAADNAAAFGTATRNVSGRALTGVGVSWAPVAWVVGEVGANQRTPDLGAVFQEIVSRPGWASGNAVALVITGTGHRTAWSWDGNSAGAPLLHVEYTAPDVPVARVTVAQKPVPVLTVRADGAGSAAGSSAIASYRFDFGDGTGAVTVVPPEVAAEHGYAAAGSYTVTLIATDTGGRQSLPASAVVAVQPDTAPAARLAVTQVTSPALTVRADGAASSDGDLTPIASYRFDFGDGSAAVTVAAPATSAQHGYAAEGTYTVSLTATDAAGNVSLPATASIAVSATVAATVEGRVAASADDAEESASGSMNLTSSDLELIFDSTNQTVGMRWALAIPRGATVRAAWIQFNAKESQSEATSLAFRAQAADNAPVFGTANLDLSSRLRTAATTLWSPAPWNAGEVGANQRTPDLAPVIQEIVNRPGWASGNALAIVVTGTGHRTAWAYNGSPAQAPLLHVEFVTGEGSPPVARLAVAQVATPAVTVRADGSASTAAASTPIASYRFDFGDGTSPVTTATPTAAAEHTYAAAGTYTVTLLVTDTAGRSSTPATASVTVTPAATAPTARLTVAQLANPALTARADGSTSTAGSSPIASYRFDFGDGTSPATIAAPTAAAQHAYAAAGTYTVTLVATDANGLGSAPASASIAVQPDSAPAARLTVTQLASPALTVRADGSASSDADLTPIASYRFDFGDGTAPVTRTAPAATADHTYAAAGTYTVTLIATDSGGRASAPANASVTAHADSAPAARLTVTQLASPALTVRADGSASSDADPTPIASYRFDFGDGTAPVTATAPAAAADHTYAAAGTYTVTLIATDTGGKASAPATASVTLRAIAVYAGYYSTHHPDNIKPKPDPWYGAPGVVFAGIPDAPSGGWDTCGLRIDNLTGAPLEGVGLAVDIGTHHFALWSTYTIPAGQKIIFAQTGYENFDGSDTNPAGCFSCNPEDCLTKVRNTIPVAHVTVGGTTTNYYDTGQVMNTHGVDAAGCPYTGGRNDESDVWHEIFPQPPAAEIAANDPARPEQSLPKSHTLTLGPASPNPTRDVLTLRFSLPSPSPVRLTVHDITGRQVKTSVDGSLEAGDYIDQIRLSDVPEGVYYCSLQTPGRTLRLKFVHVR
ncbi:MAG TPA: PKD domain-containing protein [Candidatus Eisenbacteria bacterium]